MNYTCIVIDDDPYAVEHLTDCISQMPELTLLKASIKPELALNEILQIPEAVDFLFTDIEMPSLSGLELAEQVRHKVKNLVLVTGHPEYALKGYDLQATAYLLKPFSFKHFHLAVNKLISLLEIENTFIWFKVGTMSQQIKVYINTIIAIEAMGNYIKIYTSTNEVPYIVHSSLTIAENKLRLKLKPIFIRLNKSLLVFENHIIKREGDKIYLTNGLIETIGRTYKAVFNSWFNDMMGGKSI